MCFRILIFNQTLQKFSNQFTYLIITSKSMLQKKRDDFRKQIRRNQLDKYREEKRKTLLEKHINFEILNKVDVIFSDLENILTQVARKQQDDYSMMSSVTQIDQTANITDAIGCFQQLKNLAPYDYEQIFTKYMLDKKSAEKLMRIFQDLVRNEIQNDEQSDGQSKQKYNPILRNRVLYEIVKFLDTLSYIVIGYQSTYFIIEGLWNILTDELLFSEIDNYGFLKYKLSILSKLLEDSKNQNVYRYMVQKGIGSQIVKFIDKLHKVNVLLQIHENLLKLIEHYLACELTYPPKNSDKIGEITIQTSSINQKQILLVYCILFIERNEEDLFSVVFSSLSKLIQLHEFLASSLKDEYLIKVSELILHSKRQIQNEALNLLNDFAYYSQHCIDLLLKKGYLLDLLHKRLLIESAAQDNNVTSNVQKISYIICNSLLTQKPQLKRLCLTHYIWQDIFSSFHPSHKLFPLIMVMMYFFNANGHKNFDKYLIPYLQTLRNFQWQQCRYKDSIQKSIIGIFHDAADHWQEHEQEKLLKILYEHGFLNMVEDYCDPDLIRKIKGIEMD